jgi:hypothetical protein
MKANMVNKAPNIERLFYQNDNVIIEKVLEMDLDLFNHFKENLLSDYEFIKNNVDLMYIDKNENWHCLLVVCEVYDYGILIESEGYHYARYSGYIQLTKEIHDMKWEIIHE